MLNKHNRLTRVAVKKTFQTGSFFRGKVCTARVLPSPVTRIAVSVSKKVAKSAVVRNQVRRMVYNLSRAHPLFDIVHRDIVFSINSIDKESLKGDIHTFFTQLTK